MQVLKFLALCLLLLFIGQRFAADALSLLQFPVICLLGMGLSMECGMGAGCDCSVATPVCTRAICSNGGPLGAPDQYQIDVSGIADSNCASNNCSNLDGSYTITVTAFACGGTTNDSPAPTNYWFSSACTAADTTFSVGVDFFAASIDVAITITAVSAFTPSNNNRFRYSGAAVDCSTLSGLTIPFRDDVNSAPGAGAACTGSSATVTLTKV